MSGNKRDTTRRAIVAGLAAIPMTGPSLAGTSDDSDPILIALKEIKRLERAYNQTATKLEHAEVEAAKRIGHKRPTELITWRNYFIGGPEIEWRRAALLDAHRADPAKIEAEYVDAKKRERAAIRAGRQWDKKAGIAELRLLVGDLCKRWRDSVDRLATIEPTTTKGAARLVNFLHRDLGDDATRSHRRIFRNLSSALERLEAQS
jgi:hypothetical protein